MKHYNPWLEDFYKVCKKFEEDNARRIAEKNAKTDAETATETATETAPAKDVYIINRELGREEQYQIMTKDGCGFSHVFPGKLFTLTDAEQTCKNNGFNVIKTGSMWACL